ncbi:glycosyltransferase family 4 protein [Cupriavidus necator]
MLPIYLDVTRLLDRLRQRMLPTGVDRVGLSYVQHYAHRARAVLSEGGFHVVLSERQSALAFELLLSQDTTRWRQARAVLVRGALSGLRREVVHPGVLLHTSHSGLEFRRYFNALCGRQIRTVIMVHDLIPISHAEYCRPGVRAKHLSRLKVALDHAAGIISNSQDTLDTLVHEADRAGWSMPKAVVARLASGVASQAAGPSLLEGPYFVMIGTIEARKNHWFILHVWRRLVERFGERAPKLVIIGRRGWECENAIDMLERCEALRGAVVEESDCPDSRLHNYLRHACALLFPSFVEGYGMPLVEALQMGVPVIASDLPVFREIADDIPDYLDPLDGPGWISRICAFAEKNSAARRAQIKRIGGFRAPTWKAHFETVDHFLEELA